MRLLLLFLLLPTPALPAAWPRAPGEIYVSVGHEGGGEGWTGLYVERGGPGRLTFGLDVGGHVAEGYVLLSDPLAEDVTLDGRAMSFVRIPLKDGTDGPAWSAPWLASAELGVGADLEDDGEIVPRLRLGLSFGRPLKTPLGDGWTNLDLRAEPARGGDLRAGLGLVVGARPFERVSIEMGLFAEREDDVSATLAPTVSYSVPRLGDVRLGVAVKDSGEVALRLGVARTF